MNDPEPTPALFQHGSTWVGTDFHMHTRADAEIPVLGGPQGFPIEVHSCPEGSRDSSCSRDES